jgi:hypothetical protein
MKIQVMLSFAVAVVAVGTTNLLAQAVDPNVAGPARRAVAGAADATGAPGVQQRIESREERRDAARANNGNSNAAVRNEARAANPEAWRLKYHNNQWWYYTPQNQWKYYHNNSWANYDPNTYTYVAPNNSYYARRGFLGRRYVTGYRGTYGPPATPYSNGTPAGNFGSNLGARIGATANGAAGANTGAEIGSAIGNAIGAGNAAALGNTPQVTTGGNIVAPAPNPNVPQGPPRPAPAAR